MSLTVSIALLAGRGAAWNNTPATACCQWLNASPSQSSTSLRCVAMLQASTWTLWLLLPRSRSAAMPARHLRAVALGERTPCPRMSAAERCRPVCEHAIGAAHVICCCPLRCRSLTGPGNCKDRLGSSTPGCCFLKVCACTAVHCALRSNLHLPCTCQALAGNQSVLCLPYHNECSTHPAGPPSRWTVPSVAA